jgi:NAD(P)-dependent dehydrogenase (short-subunit alcohol dehydrogenase family)
MKKIIVVGSEGLIGSAICSGLKGHKVYKCDIKKKNIKNYYQIDVNDEISTKKTFETIIKKAKRIDCVINCSYPKNENFGKNIDKLSLKDFNENLSLNIGSVYSVIRSILPHFKDNKKGNIIVTSSIYGSILPKFEIYENTTINFAMVYAPIKAAQIMLVKYFAKYFAYKKVNIRVNSIAPGGVFDNHPKKFQLQYKKFCKSKGMIKPKDLSGVTNFLVSDLSEYITGLDIPVDDGFSL